MSTSADECPIQILNEIDGGQMGWWAKGHYDRQEFARQVEQYADADNAGWYNAPPAMPVRIPVQSVRCLWWRCVPYVSEWGDRDGSVAYHPAVPGSSGAFPVTVTEHRPYAGWDGRSPRRSRNTCYCPACRTKSQRYYDELNHLQQRRERLEIWRAAANPERYRHDVVLHNGTDDRHPCRYVKWDELDAPHMRSWFDSYGITPPTAPPEVLQHVA